MNNLTTILKFDDIIEAKFDSYLPEFSHLENNTYEKYRVVDIRIPPIESIIIKGSRLFIERYGEAVEVIFSGEVDKNFPKGKLYTFTQISNKEIFHLYDNEIESFLDLDEYIGISLVFIPNPDKHDVKNFDPKPSIKNWKLVKSRIHTVNAKKYSKILLSNI